MNTISTMYRGSNTTNRAPTFQDVEALKRYGYIQDLTDSDESLSEIDELDRKTLIWCIVNSPYRKCDKEISQYLSLLMKCGLSMKIALKYIHGIEEFPQKLLNVMRIIRSYLEKILKKPNTLRVEREKMHSIDVLSKISSDNPLTVKVIPNSQIKELVNEMQYWVKTLESTEGTEQMFEDLQNSQSVDNT